MFGSFVLVELRLQDLFGNLVFSLKLLSLILVLSLGRVRSRLHWRRTRFLLYSENHRVPKLEPFQETAVGELRTQTHTNP